MKHDSFLPSFSGLKLPATSCGKSPIAKENVYFYSLANPAASNGECARCSIQGVKDSSEMPRRCKDLNLFHKSYRLCLDTYTVTKGFPKERKYKKQTLEPFNLLLQLNGR